MQINCVVGVATSCFVSLSHSPILSPQVKQKEKKHKISSLFPLVGGGAENPRRLRWEGCPSLLLPKVFFLEERRKEKKLEREERRREKKSSLDPPLGPVTAVQSGLSTGCVLLVFCSKRVFLFVAVCIYSWLQCVEWTGPGDWTPVSSAVVQATRKLIILQTSWPTWPKATRTPWTWESAWVPLDFIIITLKWAVVVCPVWPVWLCLRRPWTRSIRPSGSLQVWTDHVNMTQFFSLFTSSADLNRLFLFHLGFTSKFCLFLFIQGAMELAGSKDENGRRSLVANWTCWNLCSPRPAIRTSSCEKKWPSRSTCRNLVSR